jgi:hypothetical protein
VTVWARVSGVPKGKSVRLTATASNGTFRPLTRDCSGSGHSYVCTATGGHRWFAFQANASSRPTVTFRVTPPSGYTDPSSGNDSASFQVSGGRGSSG